ncbi:hypothetical protein FOA52_000887 [Chlamydomonas sp. UWO 241]|nr:hypothetical protein FOA52_000887 [Chlamydomonas sp. UWO 241]
MLKDLCIRSCQSLSSLAPLSACCQLERLDMAVCFYVANLAPLSSCAHLKELNMSNCVSVASVETLTACAQLEELSIYGLDEQLPGLEALKVAMPRLRIYDDASVSGGIV